MDICQANACTFLRIGMMQQTSKMIITRTIRTIVPILVNTAPYCPNFEANQSHDSPLPPAFSVTSCLSSLSLDIAVVNDPPVAVFSGMQVQQCSPNISQPESSLMLVGSAKQPYWFHVSKSFESFIRVVYGPLFIVIDIVNPISIFVWCDPKKYGF